MKKLTIEIAEKRIGIQAGYENIVQQCNAYLTEEAPEIMVQATVEDITQMRE